MLYRFIGIIILGYSHVHSVLMEGRVRGDIWYIEHWSFWLDLYIIFKTVWNVIVGDKKAY